MRTSELIEKLEEFIEEHGNLPEIYKDNARSRIVMSVNVYDKDGKYVKNIIEVRIG